MHTAARKLHSQRGASMLFALLVFFLCLLAGVAALTVAAANVGRYTRLESEQQQYYSVASALELLQAQLDDKSETDPVKIEVECVETYQWWYEDTGTAGDPLALKTNRSTAYNWKTPLDPNDLTYFQYQLLQYCLPAEWRSELTGPITPPSGEEKAYTVDLDRAALGASAPDWANALYPVKVTVKNGADVADAGPYTLEMLLTTQDDGGAYPLKAVWSGEAKTGTDTNTTTRIESAPISPASGTPVGEVGVRTTTTTLTCTLRWSAGNRTVTFG